MTAEAGDGRCVAVLRRTKCGLAAGQFHGKTSKGNCIGLVGGPVDQSIVRDYPCSFSAVFALSVKVSRGGHCTAATCLLMLVLQLLASRRRQFFTFHCHGRQIGKNSPHPLSSTFPGLEFPPDPEMADERLFRSNGTCWTGPGIRADDDFIPCGNDLFGRKTCCGLGDMCLSSLACYNARFGLTYLLGCTDPEFKHESCPNKLNSPRGKGEQSPIGSPLTRLPPDYPWVGLVYCNGTSSEWSACSQKAKESTLAKPDVCWCPTTSRTVAFTDKSILENIVSLPTVSGGFVNWQAGHTPLATATSESTSSSSSSTTTPAPSTGSISPTATSAVPGTQSETVLSTNTKIGIGVGVGLGTIILLAILIALFFLLRRRKNDEDSDMGQEAEPEKTLGIPGTPNTPATSVPSELEPTAARPWSLRSELDSSSPRTLAEAEGNNHQYYYYPRGPQAASELPG